MLAEARAAALEAEAKKSLADAGKSKAEGRKAVADAKRSEVELARVQRAEREELAKDQHFHIYVFDEAVGAASAEKCILKLAQWSRTDPGCDIEIIFNSPGGDVVAGMALFDYIQRVRKQDHRVTTTALGMAASMAGILLQAGDTRKMGPEAWLLIHEASFGTHGSFGDVVDTVKWIEKIQDRILGIFARRSEESDPETATNKLTKNQIKRRWHRTDWWISSDDALKHGFVDEIA
jgi:Vilmaviridae head maturation protease